MNHCNLRLNDEGRRQSPQPLQTKRGRRHQPEQSQPTRDFHGRPPSNSPRNQGQIIDSPRNGPRQPYWFEELEYRNQKQRNQNHPLSPRNQNFYTNQQSQSNQMYQPQSHSRSYSRKIPSPPSYRDLPMETQPYQKSSPRKVTELQQKRYSPKTQVT